MPSFPQPGKVTIGEINRELVTADHLSDDQARETYGKVLGTVFGPVPFESDSISGAEAEQMDVLPRQGNLGILSAVVQSLTSGSVKALFEPADVKLLQYVDLHAVSWHSYKHILAFISGLHQVTICDYDDSDGKSPCVLSSELQKEVKFIEWRPNDGKTLYVACKGGICIWTASYPGNVASVRAVVTSSIISRSSSTRWTLVDFLRSHDNEQISSLSWSPNGRYLASAAFENSSFTIWDVAQGLGTPFRRGLGGISVLSWSPCGDYFFAAKFDGTFYLWETNTWTSEPWSSKNGFVTGATWDPDGRMILLSFSESSTLGSIHFASKAPSLDNADSKTLRSQICTGLESYIMLSGVRLLSLFAWTSGPLFTINIVYIFINIILFPIYTSIKVTCGCMRHCTTEIFCCLCLFLCYL
ncbi:aladin isoform X2 [Henckelia pumila]|uniref:aladin isoform X2 n=1 Tax=Henckelia pumila TaxID=405737 RepID=UPI003C6E3784